jgi:hypothetical protein
LAQSYAATCDRGRSDLAINPRSDSAFRLHPTAIVHLDRPQWSKAIPFLLHIELNERGQLQEVWEFGQSELAHQDGARLAAPPA